ncbi:hypothetical protein B0A48_00684 [Cryoendolithus antarcticus]|uniref:Uncharacterized protein n=1 Tax=Cryoendolithus antarcticus TaxID=1507870 RepID=A0A1V8TVJ5_9PEZI|nr:hypothetical protein B0A48_00684 [Cryoendolithus antarcticus]
MLEIEDLTSELSGLTTGIGPFNHNNGAGQQTNATISDGTHNKQYVAHTQNFLAPSADTSRDLLDIIFITDPSIDRVKLERLKGTITEAYGRLQHTLILKRNGVILKKGSLVLKSESLIQNWGSLILKREMDQMAENEITAQSLEKIYGRRAGRDEQQKRDVKEAAPKK